MTGPLPMDHAGQAALGREVLRPMIDPRRLEERIAAARRTLADYPGHVSDVEAMAAVAELAALSPAREDQDLAREVRALLDAAAGEAAR